MNTISGFGVESFNLYGLHTSGLSKDVGTEFTDVMRKGLDNCKAVPGMQGVYAPNSQTIASLNIVKVDPPK